MLGEVYANAQCAAVFASHTDLADGRGAARKEFLSSCAKNVLREKTLVRTHHSAVTLSTLGLENTVEQRDRLLAFVDFR